MSISKINSSIAFNGKIIVPEGKNDLRNDFRVIDTEDISQIIKYKNGTLIHFDDTTKDCFVSSKKTSFQDIAAAYNMARNNQLEVDLTKSSMNTDWIVYRLMKRLK